MTKVKFKAWDFIKIAAVLTLFGKCSYDIYDGSRMRDFLKHKPKKTTNAVVTDEKYYWGNSPVSHFNTLKYKFYIDKKEYWGVTNNDNYTPGQQIQIDYVLENPNYNCAHGLYTD